MKTKSTILALAAFVTISSQFSTCYAQGSLTPPVGTPAPVMKSLDQIEARTAITNTSSTVTISQPGSYYLTGNLTVSSGTGIYITTNGVTLDLNGYTIRSTSAGAGGAGIYLDSSSSASLKNITIMNGHIQSGTTNNGSGVYSGPGFFNGIAYVAGTGVPFNVLISHVTVSGCSGSGIVLSTIDSSVVENCAVRTVGQSGISATIVKNCVAIDCGFSAITGEQVSDCHGEASTSYGINATTAVNSYGESSTGTGVQAKVANNCVGYRNSGTAINATVANGCYAQFGTNIITYKYNMP